MESKSRKNLTENMDKFEIHQNKYLARMVQMWIE